MTIRKWTLVTRRRNGAMAVQRFVWQGRAERAYRSACSRTYMGENPIIEIWFFRPRERQAQ